MKDWYEISVQTSSGRGRLCLPPIAVHGGYADPIVRKFASLHDADEAKQLLWPRDELSPHIIHCYEDGSEVAL